MRKPIQIVVVSLLVFEFVLGTRAFAAQQLGITVSPAVVETAVKPGESTKSQLTLTNGLNSNQQISISFVPLDVSGQQSAGKSSLNDAWKWLSVGEKDFEIAPNETKSIELNISAPANAGPGGHYGEIVVRAQAKSSNPNQTQVATSTNVLLAVTVPGKSNESLKIKSVSAPKKTGSESFTSNVVVENTGNVHLLPTGIATLHGFGFKQDVKIPAQLILPQTTKTYSIVFKKHVYLGKLSTKVSIDYGAGKTAVASSGSTWVVQPIVIVVAVLLIGLFVFVVIAFFRRRKRRRSI
jgi:hypothetical protein